MPLPLRRRQVGDLLSSLPPSSLNSRNWLPLLLQLMVTEPYPPFVVHFLTAFVIFSRLLDESGRMHCLAVSVARSLSIDDGRKISAPVCLIGAGSEADGS